MERQYKVEMTITVDDEVLQKECDKVNGATIDDIVMKSMEDAPFQIDCLTVS